MTKRITDNVLDINNFIFKAILSQGNKISNKQKVYDLCKELTTEIHALQFDEKGDGEKSIFLLVGIDNEGLQTLRLHLPNVNGQIEEVFGSDWKSKVTKLQRYSDGVMIDPKEFFNI